MANSVHTRHLSQSYNGLWFPSPRSVCISHVMLFWLKVEGLPSSGFDKGNMMPKKPFSSTQKYIGDTSNSLDAIK